MSVNEVTGEYVGVGDTEAERVIDAALQDLLDDMTRVSLYDMATYLKDAGDYLTGDLPDDEDPHEIHVEARRALGRMMLWQGWAPPGYQLPFCQDASLAASSPRMGWGA